MRNGTRIAPDEAAALRRQAGKAARALLRPATYAGAARELALGAVHVATYPFGALPQRHARAHEPLGGLPPLTDADTTAGMPVLLLHGYVHNRSAFLVMSRSLKRAGFRWVHSLNYNPVADDLAAGAARLGAEVERVLEASGASRCQIVGHSMGGMIARHYVQELGGEDTVDTVVTLGSPHRGTFSAYLAASPAVTQLRPGSAYLRHLDETARPSDVRWIAYYCDLDATIVPATSAKLLHPALGATNIRARDTGHLSLLVSREVIGSLVEHLTDRTLGRPGASPVANLPSASQRHRRGAGAGSGQAAAPSTAVSAPVATS